MASEVRRFLEEHEGPLCVGCSGGSDSLFLLYGLRAYFPSRELYVLHFNHGIRAESESEEELVKRHGERLGTDVVVGRRKAVGPHHEDDLRRKRYGFFEAILQRLGGKMLVLGHQADDVVETVLMRLLCGSGLSGLSAPRSVNVFPNHVRLRPLLNMTKREIEEILKAVGIEWAEDRTNADPQICFRNRIRQRLVPFLDELLGNRNWRKGILRSRALLEEEEAGAEWAVGELGCGVIPKQSLPLEPLRGRPKSFCRRMLWRWMLAQNSRALKLRASAIDDLVERVFTGREGTLPMGPDGRWVVKGNVLSFEGGTLVHDKSCDPRS
jgi:tRNA(Ile)-lysidine synthetase-like protein